MPKGAISGIINIAFLATSIATGVFVVRETQTIESQASSTLTTLTITTNDARFQTGERFAVSVNLESSQNPVGYINALIHYDPHTLHAVDITPGNFFENQLVLDTNINQSSGEVKMSLENAPGTTPKLGTGNVAFIVLEALKPGNTTISIHPSSHVSVNRSQPNQLESSNNLTIQIN